MKYLVTLLVLVLGESAGWAASAFLHAEAARSRPADEPVSLLWLAVAGSAMLLNIAWRCRASEHVH